MRLCKASCHFRWHDVQFGFSLLVKFMKSEIDLYNTLARSITGWKCFILRAYKIGQRNFFGEKSGKDIRCCLTMSFNMFPCVNITLPTKSMVAFCVT